MMFAGAWVARRGERAEQTEKALEYLDNWLCESFSRTAKDRM